MMLCDQAGAQTHDPSTCSQAANCTSKPKIFLKMKWGSSWENLLPYGNNKDADQLAHPRSLISIFVIRCLDSFKTLPSLCSWASQFESCQVTNSQRQVFSWSGSNEGQLIHSSCWHDRYMLHISSMKLQWTVSQRFKIHGILYLQSLWENSQIFMLYPSFKFR